MKRALLLATLVFTACALHASDVDGVIAKLKGGAIDTLYYDDTDIGVLLKDLIETKDNEDLLISAYHALGKEQVYLKHTLLIVMIRKQTHNLNSNDARQKLKAVMVGALRDEHFWIRTEAVLGLRFFGDTSRKLLTEDIGPMILDNSECVRKEAFSTYVELIELRQDLRENVF